ncbi:Uncharacterised protein [Mycobacteroides abscessus subsp. bolletii]|uniref:hypothetical protein n=1 Tax=Mycobacteroides abscessus TaxID=36809 RepID=UPI0009A7DAE6|nr:hypothetical protein [Mycobacteroides abscessus]SLF21328.1 Uncharacterised protein [Mycobacteroides abscessus subsp. bolletii]
MPKWHKRTTMRTEKRRLLAFLAENDLRNKRENNDIRLADDARAHISAIVLIECFAPSNIKDLFASIDKWPLRPPEYLEDVKNDVKKWRNSDGAGAWRHVALFARPESKLFDYSADPTVPAGIRGVECFLSNPLPSLTTFVAIFHVADECADISDDLRKFFQPRLAHVNFRARGRLARFTHHLPFSRANNVYYNVNVVGPDLLQREHVDNVFRELEAHCWQWMNERAKGKVGVLPADRRPSIRCVLLDNLEPFWPIKSEGIEHDFSKWNEWHDSANEQPFGGPRGPLEALRLKFSLDAWTDPDRQSFYFANEDTYNDFPLHAYFAANRETVCKALDMESDSGMNVFSSILRRFSLGLLSAWSVERLLSRYQEEIADIRDSSASSRSAYSIAEMLNDFLTRDGHDAAVISRDATRQAELDYSFRGTPRFISMMDIQDLELARQRSTSEPAEGVATGEEHGNDYEEAVDAQEPELLVQRLKREIASTAAIVSDELEMATRSITTSATLLQSMASIRLQYWAIGVAVVATVIAAIAIIVS